MSINVQAVEGKIRAKKKRRETASLTRAKFVSGPSASTDTSPGNSETFSTKNSATLFSILLVLGGGKKVFPKPSLP